MNPAADAGGLRRALVERRAALLRRGPAAALLRLGPAAIVVAFAAWLLWPVPAGVMPLSADHTVHLTRIVLTANRLSATGSLSGWEPTWFFGFPLGELYPQLGDLAIIALHTLGLGSLDWPQAYALGFFLVFALQGLVLLRVGRLFGYGAWPGLVAALLLLADAGFTREGGWMYTVYFGVWPQALATSLAWLGLGELARALGWPATRRLDAGRAAVPEPAAEQAAGRRATLRAALALGAALLAHPIALPSIVIGGGLLVITLVPRAPAALGARRATARCLLAALLAAGLAAWWWLPMLQHRAWMASYGWLFADLEHMLRWLVEDGRWAQRMAPAAGRLALVGLVLAALGAGRVARFVALFALVQWLLASSDLFWQLRLDRFSEGFTHLQYQRFLIGAKPGLFLCAGLAVAAPASWARRLVSGPAAARVHGWRRAVSWAAALGLAAAAATATAWLVADSRASVVEHKVGAVQVERIPGDPSFEAHYRELLAWAAARWTSREQDYRLAVRAPRNSHWFMDAPVWTGTPQYKLGFTPGDNFVHKPESGRAALLDALGVRYVVSRGRARPGELARFGPLAVRERATTGLRPLAWLEGTGSGSVVATAADLRAGWARVELAGVEGGEQLVFAVAGYPRWRLFVDGVEAPWVEVPVWGDGPSATPEQRRAGALRGGKARGDDGSEPTLIAAELPAGAKVVELRYAARSSAEWLAEIASLLSWVLVSLALLARGPWSARLQRGLDAGERTLARALHPLVVAVFLVAVGWVAAERWRSAAQAEASELLGWVEAGATQHRRAEAGAIKTDMLIRPAVRLRPNLRPDKRPALVALTHPQLPATLRGWYGLDDDQAQTTHPGRHQLRIEVRPRASQDDFSTLWSVTVPHAPQRVPFTVQTGSWAGRDVELRVVSEARGRRRPPPLGVNLELGAKP